MHDGEREAQALALPLGQPIGAARGQVVEAKADECLLHRAPALGARQERDASGIVEVALDAEPRIQPTVAGGEKADAPVVFPPVGLAGQSVDRDRAGIRREDRGPDP